jgi:hypothetical protein
VSAIASASGARIDELHEQEAVVERIKADAVQQKDQTLQAAKLRLQVEQANLNRAQHARLAKQASLITSAPNEETVALAHIAKEMAEMQAIMRLIMESQTPKAKELEEPTTSPIVEEPAASPEGTGTSQVTTTEGTGTLHVVTEGADVPTSSAEEEAVIEGAATDYDLQLALGEQHAESSRIYFLKHVS